MRPGVAISSENVARIARDPTLSPEDIEALKPKKAARRSKKPKVKRVDPEKIFKKLVAAVELQAIITADGASKAIINGDTIGVGGVVRVGTQALRIIKITDAGVVFSWKRWRALKSLKGGLE